MTRVLFLCIGNSCRSQMAEGFARTYGRDVISAQSAGIAPAPEVAPLTKKVMLEKNIDLSGSFPKGPDLVPYNSFDLVVNMSGTRLMQGQVPMEDWNVRDPMGESEDVFRQVAQQIESLVMNLVLRLRAAKRG
jgi:arsenate reductase